MEYTTARRAIGALALLFLIKTAILALFVTPLWEVPDEPGHYAYVLDLTEQRGFPVYGKTPLPAEVIASWKVSAAERPPFNWVAQHPPLYHLLAAPFLLGARQVTDDAEWRLRAPRLFSVLAGTAALILFFLAFREATGDPAFALAGAGAVSFLPMYTHLSSGTHHEVLVALAMGAAALFFARLVRTGKFSDGMRMALVLAAAGATKLTAVPVALALLVLTPKYLAGRGGTKFAQWLAIAATALSLPALWALRNLSTSGHPLAYPAGRSFRLAELFAHLREQPVFDHTFKNFLGLIGWTGTGELRWFQISGPYLALYLALGIIMAVSAAAWLWKSEKRGRGLFVAVFGLVFFGLLPAGGPPGGLAKHFLYSLLAALPFFCLPALLTKSPPREEIVRSSLFVVLVFGSAYLANVWRGLAIYGEMRAVHGRYFFAVLPFAALALAYPAVLLWKERKRRDLALLLILLALLLNESAFFLFKVLPFYRAAS